MPPPSLPPHVFAKTSLKRDDRAVPTPPSPPLPKSPKAFHAPPPVPPKRPSSPMKGLLLSPPKQRPGRDVQAPPLPLKTPPPLVTSTPSRQRADRSLVVEANVKSSPPQRDGVTGEPIITALVTISGINSVEYLRQRQEEREYGGPIAIFDEQIHADLLGAFTGVALGPGQEPGEFGVSVAANISAGPVQAVQLEFSSKEAPPVLVDAAWSLRIDVSVFLTKQTSSVVPASPPPRLPGSDEDLGCGSDQAAIERENSLQLTEALRRYLISKGALRGALVFYTHNVPQPPSTLRSNPMVQTEGCAICDVPLLLIPPRELRFVQPPASAVAAAKRAILESSGMTIVGHNDSQMGMDRTVGDASLHGAFDQIVVRETRDLLKQIVEQQQQQSFRGKSYTFSPLSASLRSDAIHVQMILQPSLDFRRIASTQQEQPMANIVASDLLPIMEPYLLPPPDIVGRSEKKWREGSVSVAVTAGAVGGRAGDNFPPALPVELAIEILLGEAVEDADVVHSVSGGELTQAREEDKARNAAAFELRMREALSTLVLYLLGGDHALQRTYQHYATFCGEGCGAVTHSNKKIVDEAHTFINGVPLHLLYLRDAQQIVAQEVNSSIEADPEMIRKLLTAYTSLPFAALQSWDEIADKSASIPGQPLHAHGGSSSRSVEITAPVGQPKLEQQRGGHASLTLSQMRKPDAAPSSILHATLLFPEFSYSLFEQYRPGDFIHAVRTDLFNGVSSFALFEDVAVNFAPAPDPAKSGAFTDVLRVDGTIKIDHRHESIAGMALSMYLRTPGAMTHSLAFATTSKISVSRLPPGFTGPRRFDPANCFVNGVQLGPTISHPPSVHDADIAPFSAHPTLIRVVVTFNRSIRRSDLSSEMSGHFLSAVARDLHEAAEISASDPRPTSRSHYCDPEDIETELIESQEELLQIDAFIHAPVQDKAYLVASISAYLRGKVPMRHAVRAFASLASPQVTAALRQLAADGRSLLDSSLCFVNDIPLEADVVPDKNFFLTVPAPSHRHSTSPAPQQHRLGEGSDRAVTPPQPSETTVVTVGSSSKHHHHHHHRSRDSQATPPGSQLGTIIIGSHRRKH